VSLSLEQLAGQALVVGFPGRAPPPELVTAAADGSLGGVILFKRNLGTPVEVARLVASFAAPAELPLIMAIDQEGGRVARLGPPVVRLPPMRALARTGDESLVRDAAKHLGLQLRAFGFTMDFAPVLDVDTNPDNPVIGDRSFGSTADEVIRFGLAFARGLEDAGIGSCAKHFPGHGDTDLDSHVALPRLSHDRARLDAVELAPFRAARGVIPSLMSAHVVFESLEPGVPATLSRRAMTDLLRGELGWDGLTISDDLEMRAVADHYGVEASAVSAIAAGCDALLVCSDLALVARARTALAERADSDSMFRARLEDAVSRGLRMRKRYRSAPMVDAALLDETLDPRGTAALEARIASALAEIPSS
jgi:beta-N-acetylhexosaminidase